jgi:hypothetical protein
MAYLHVRHDRADFVVLVCVGHDIDEIPRVRLLICALSQGNMNNHAAVPYIYKSDTRNWA